MIITIQLPKGLGLTSLYPLFLYSPNHVTSLKGTLTPSVVYITPYVLWWHKDWQFSSHRWRQLSLHKDLHTKLAWSEKSDMPFNIEKCQVIQVGTKNKKYRYKMCGIKFLSKVFNMLRTWMSALHQTINFHSIAMMLWIKWTECWASWKETSLKGRVRFGDPKNIKKNTFCEKNIFGRYTFWQLSRKDLKGNLR